MGCDNSKTTLETDPERFDKKTMGHGIKTERDFVIGFSTDKNPAQDWHKLTRFQSEPITGDAFPEIIDAPLQLEGKTLRIGGSPWVVPISTDDGDPCGKPHSVDSYSLCTPRDGLAWAQECLAGTRFHVERAGMLWDRSFWFFGIWLDELSEIDPTGGNRFFLNMSNSIDGTSPRQMELSTIRPVCWNTISLSRRTGRVLFKTRSTKNANARMSDATSEIEAAVGMAKVFQAAMDRVAQQPANDDTARGLYAGFLGAGKDVPSRQLVNRTDELVSLFRRGDGNKGETMADVLNGFTQAFTRGFADSKRAPGDVFGSGEFGGNADTKSEFANLILGPAPQRAKVRDAGLALLAKPVPDRDAVSVN